MGANSRAGDDDQLSRLHTRATRFPFSIMYPMR